VRGSCDVRHNPVVSRVVLSGKRHSNRRNPPLLRNFPRLRTIVVACGGAAGRGFISAAAVP
jgi:hypothetical protein